MLYLSRYEERNMKILWQCVALFSCVFVVSAVYAYSLSCDATSCTVTCDNGQYVGTMYWNGTKWSDGVRSSTDKDQLARQIVAAQGTACQ